MKHAFALLVVLALVAIPAAAGEFHVSVDGNGDPEIARHWQLPSGVVVSLRVTDRDSHNITASCDHDGCMSDDVVAALTDLADVGVQSVGLGVGSGWDLERDVRLDVQAVVSYRFHYDAQDHLEPFMSKDLSYMLEARASRGQFVGFVAYEVHDEYSGGFGPNVVSIVDKDYNGVRIGLGIRF